MCLRVCNILFRMGMWPTLSCYLLRVAHTTYTKVKLCFCRGVVSSDEKNFKNFKWATKCEISQSEKMVCLGEEVDEIKKLIEW